MKIEFLVKMDGFGGVRIRKLALRAPENHPRIRFLSKLRSKMTTPIININFKNSMA